VERLTDIATVPRSLQRITALLSSPTASAQEVADEIAKDQALAAKVLKLMNSGFCAIQSPISTISRAMVLLGFDVVRSLVLSASMFDLFDQTNELLEGLWEHSMGTAKAANGLAQRLGAANPEQYAVAGLLHDIGKVVIAQAFPAELRKVRAVVAERGGLQVDAEREVLGVTHADVGLWLMQRWALPPKLVNPIAYHHSFDAGREHADRTAVVHLADILSRAKGFGNPGDRLIPAINRDAWALVNLTMNDLRGVLAQLDADVVAGGF
jgi:putative nucleotidyltransferase with HDIG domain